MVSFALNVIRSNGGLKFYEKNKDKILEICEKANHRIDTG